MNKANIFLLFVISLLSLNGCNNTKSNENLPNFDGKDAFTFFAEDNEDLNTKELKKLFNKSNFIYDSQFEADVKFTNAKNITPLDIIDNYNFQIFNIETIINDTTYYQTFCLYNENIYKLFYCNELDYLPTHFALTDINQDNYFELLISHDNVIYCFNSKTLNNLSISYSVSNLFFKVESNEHIQVYSSIDSTIDNANTLCMDLTPNKHKVTFKYDSLHIEEENFYFDVIFDTAEFDAFFNCTSHYENGVDSRSLGTVKVIVQCTWTGDDYSYTVPNINQDLPFPLFSNENNKIGGKHWFVLLPAEFSNTLKKGDIQECILSFEILDIYEGVYDFKINHMSYVSKIYDDAMTIETIK